MARFDEAAQAFVDDPAGRVAVALRQPADGSVEGEDGMVFADVVEVVGDGGADVGRGVVVEQVEDADDGFRVLNKGLVACRPGQARVDAFGGKAVHVVAGGLCPGGDALHGQFVPVPQVGADGVFAGVASGDLFDGVEGLFGVRQSVGFDVVRHWHYEIGRASCRERV